MILDPLDESRVNQIRKELENNQTADRLKKDIHALPFYASLRRAAVIQLTKLNDHPFVLNADWIETVESTPDTVITLVNGKKYLVKESVEIVRNACVAYQKEIQKRS